MNELHRLGWPLLVTALGVISGGSAIAAVRDAYPAVLEWARRAVLIVLVAQAAIGLSLAVRGAGPAEGLHWVYGVGVIVALLVPGSLAAETPAAHRSWALAAAAAVAAVLVWRLWASG